MKTLVVATFNPHKLREIRSLAGPLGIRVLSLEAFPHLKPPREHGKTFQENAVLKARAVARKTGLPALADDSGICVDALGGGPGVRSARFSGSGRNDEANNRKLLRKLADVPDARRGAHYFCSIAVASPKRLIGVANGTVRGRIACEARGRQGFGYDPIFYYPPFRKTFGEIQLSLKNKVSHRARALKKAVKLLKKLC